MTGFDLLDFLWRQPADVLRSDIFAGLNDEDRIIEASVTDDEYITLTTEAGKKAEEESAEEERLMQRDYWRQKKDEWAYDDYVQESIRRMNNDI